ncbi:MAG: hypothetical protein PHZ04_01665 [Patescibacteria group bacterium]|nr:hypothetical protein [Patescibacteria group bacterium]MDD5294979.1 hypothetical protein [Patescibacteria group bacterium]MDD5554772.1 hypothetical protein [Patescibacteria group bacterium]
MREDWKMFRKLWGIVKPDCRWALLWEFLLDPSALRQRYQNEVIFKLELRLHWQGQRKEKRKRKKKKD